MSEPLRLEIEPGSARDRCGFCGGWRSLGHAVGSGCRPSEEGERFAQERIRRARERRDNDPDTRS
jgi:hypothetical protein